MPACLCLSTYPYDILYVYFCVCVCMHACMHAYIHTYTIHERLLDVVQVTTMVKLHLETWGGPLQQKCLNVALGNLIFGACYSPGLEVPNQTVV